MNKRRRRQYRKERRMAHGRWMWLALGGWLVIEQGEDYWRVRVPTREEADMRDAYQAYLAAWKSSPLTRLA